MLEFEENSTKESVIDFLEKIKENTPGKDIVLVLDNFSSHKSKKTRETAEEHYIDLVFLSPLQSSLKYYRTVMEGFEKEYFSSICGEQEKVFKVDRELVQVLITELGIR